MTNHSQAEIDYHEAMKEFRIAARKFSEIQEAYRARTIGDIEFLEGRKAYDAAGAVVDALESALI